MSETIEKAIERMQKVEAACAKLIAMAEKDIAELKKRKKRARKLIEGFTRLPGTKYNQMVERTALEIVNADLAPVSCMGVQIKT